MLGVIERINAPLAAPSANISGSPSPTTCRHVLDDLDGRIGLIIEGGPCPVGLESTVLSCLSGSPVVLRPGGITVEDLQPFFDTKIEIKNKAAKDGETPLSPGTKYTHYSPKALVVLFKGSIRSIESHMNKYLADLSENTNMEESIACLIHSGVILKTNGLKRNVVLYSEGLSSEIERGSVAICNLGETKREISRNIFGYFRDLDKACSTFLVVRTDNALEGLAIMDRLEKSSDKIVLCDK
jgi:L-threonylcarbamoyladenylate synthase